MHMYHEINTYNNVTLSHFIVLTSPVVTTVNIIANNFREGSIVTLKIGGGYCYQIPGHDMYVQGVHKIKGVYV